MPGCQVPYVVNKCFPTGFDITPVGGHPSWLLSRGAISCSGGEGDTMRAQVRSWLVVGVSLCTASSAVAQAPVGALAIDARQGDQWGWAVDYETMAAAREMALRECGSGCSVVLTFGRCAGVCGRPGRGRHGGWLGAIVCIGVGRA